MTCPISWVLAALVVVAPPLRAQDTWVVDQPTLQVQTDGKRMTVTSRSRFVKNGSPIDQYSADLAPCANLTLVLPDQRRIPINAGRVGKDYLDLAKAVAEKWIMLAMMRDPGLLSPMDAPGSNDLGILQRPGILAKVVITSPDTQEFHLADVKAAGTLPEPIPIPGIGVLGDTPSPAPGGKPGQGGVDLGGARDPSFTPKPKS